jgi:protein transport protein SEC24
VISDWARRSFQGTTNEVPVVKDTVIARCRRCRTYINPYVTFIEGGNRWKCPMCNLSNEVPQMFDWDQEKNQPADRWKRAELNESVVEFVAPTEYMVRLAHRPLAFSGSVGLSLRYLSAPFQVRPPQPPCYVFLIDVSEAAVKTGMVATAARTILESLDRLPNADGRTKVALIAVDTSLHFFCLPPGSTDPTMLVVSDLEDVFLPKPQDLLVNAQEARPALENLLGRLSDMFADTYTTGSALGAGLQAAFKLVSNIGGKIITLSASLPSVGPGALKNRDDRKLLGTSKESTLLQPASSFYKTFAIDCSRAQVSVDMFLFSSAYTDIASLSRSPALDSTLMRPTADPVRFLNLLCQAASPATPVARRTSTRASTPRGPRTPSSLRTSLAKCWLRRSASRPSSACARRAACG